jgi:hypothetical protein
MDHSKEEWQNVDDFDDPKEFANYLDAIPFSIRAKAGVEPSFCSLFSHG